MGIVTCSADLFPEHVELLHRAGHQIHLAKTPGLTALRSTLPTADALICLLTDPIGSDILEQAPRLKIIANVAVGYENIDVAAAAEKGIVVTNTPDVLTEATADQTFALLLAAARRIPEADHTIRSEPFPAWSLQQPLTGFDVAGKVLGIVGAGRIGSAVARRGHHGFGMPVLYHSRARKPDLDAELQARHVSLETLLEQSDFVCIHVPLTPETYHMFNADAFARMKPTAILVNVSRGAVVDEAALVHALQHRIIAGAALDVFEHEPVLHPGLSALREHVVLAPHLGSATVETRNAMADIAVRNVLAVLSGRPPLTPVTI